MLFEVQLQPTEETENSDDLIDYSNPIISADPSDQFKAQMLEISSNQDEQQQQESSLVDFG